MSFKKYKLISDEELDRLRQKQISTYNPTLTTLSKIQGELQSILDNNRDIAIEDKLTILNILQQRFHSLQSSATGKIIQSRIEPLNPANLTQNINQHPPLPAADKELEDQDEPDEEELNPLFPSDKMIASVVNSFDPVDQNNVQKFLNHILLNPDDLSFDNNLQIVIKGSPIANSNIIHSLKRILSIPIPGKRVLKGHKLFISSLNKIRLPRPFSSILRHKSCKVTKPPGKKPHILSVYRH